LTLRARFEAKVDRSGGQESCWVWTGSRTDFGYGLIVSGGKRGRILRAHRVADGCVEAAKERGEHG